MVIENYMVRFYPSVKILDYPWVYYDRYEDYLPKKDPRELVGHVRTGSMDWGRFTALKDDIEKHGVENPFIIEHYCKDLPNAKGFRDAPVLAIRTGNNRAEAMSQLKIFEAPALFVVPKTQLSHLPTSSHTDIPIDCRLGGTVAKLWKEVVRGNDEPLGVVSAWRDSELLTDIIRESRNVGR